MAERFELGIDRRVVFGVPSGVGDVYWALCKLKAIRERYRIRHVTLAVQRTKLTRALEWQRMVDFVDGTMERPFRLDADGQRDGYSRKVPGMTALLWPNSIIDRGGMLADWLPEFELDLDFPIQIEPPKKSGAVLVYVSSEGVNAAWCSNLGAYYWSAFLEELGNATGVVPTVIGKSWDASFLANVRAPFENLVDQTSLPQVAGLIANASVLVGVISGMTILANHFRTPCLALHPNVPMNPRAWVAADAPYLPMLAADAPRPAGLATLVASLMERPVPEGRLCLA